MNIKIIKTHNYDFLQKYSYAFLLLCISLISITWFRGNFQLAIGDFLFPPRRIEEFQRSFYSWDHLSLGSANFRILASSVPFGIYLALTEVIGISLVVAEKIWLYFSFASMGLSMYFLTITVVVKEKFRYLAGFLAALLFMFNPWIATTNAMLWPYIVFLPLILGLYIKGLNEKRGFKYILIFCLLWIVTSTVSLINLRGGLHQWMTLFIYLVFFLLINRKKDDAKHAFVFSASLLFCWALLTMFYLLPISINIFGTIQEAASTYQAINFTWMDAYKLNSVHLSEAFRLMGFWAFEHSYKGYPYSYWSPTYKTLLFILIGFLLPILAYSALFLKKQPNHTKKHLLFFGIITAFGLFIMMGSLNPINLLFAKYIPFFVTLFSLPYFFGGIFVVLGFSVLGGFSIALLFNNSLKGIKGKCLKSISVALVFLLIGVYGFPIWSGEFIYPGNKILGSARYNIPMYYQGAGAWLEGQENNFRIFALPYSILGCMAYTWPPKGFVGPDPSPYLLNRDIITGSGFGLNFANKLAEFNISGLSKLLGIMNVRYMLIHNDANWELIEDNSWYISPPSKFSELLIHKRGEIQFVKSFGKLDFYKISDEYFLPHIYPSSRITLVSSDINSLVSLTYTPYIDGYPALVFTGQQSKESFRSLVGGKRLEVGGKGSEKGRQSHFYSQILFANNNLNDLVIDMARVEGAAKGEKLKVKGEAILVKLDKKGKGSFEVEEDGVYEVWLGVNDKLIKHLDSIKIGNEKYLIKKEDITGKWSKLGIKTFEKGKQKVRLRMKKDIKTKEVTSLQPEIVIVSEKKLREYEEILKRKEISYIFYKEKGDVSGPENIGEQNFYIPKSSEYEIMALIRPKKEKVRAYATNENFEEGISKDWDFRTRNREQSRHRSGDIPLVFYGPSWHGEERDHHGGWRWGPNNMRLFLLNPNSQTLQGALTFRVITIRERNLEVAVNGEFVKSIHLPANYDKAARSLVDSLRELITGKNLPPYEPRYPPEWSTVTVEDITLKPGENEVVLYTPQGARVMDEELGNGDKREVSIQLWDDIGFEVTGNGSERNAAFGNTRYEYSTAGKNLVLKAYFNGDSREQEYILMAREFPGVDLEQYPFFNFTYKVSDPAVQTVDAAFGIDYSGDGQTDGYVLASSVPAEGEMQISLDLFETARRRFADAYYKERRELKLVKLFLIPHKKWGLDASGAKKGMYRFILGNLQIYNDHSITVNRPQVRLSGAVVRGTGSVDVQSQVEDGQLKFTALPGKDRWNESFLEALKGAKGYRRIFILKDGQGVTGTIGQIDGNFVWLTDVEEFGGKDLVLHLSDLRGAGAGAVEVSIPISGQLWQKYPYLSLEYGAEQALDQDIEVWLGVLDKKRGIQKVFAGKSLLIERHHFQSAVVHLDRGRGIRIFEFSLDQAFPEGYTTQGGSRGRFVVLKNGRPIDTTWQIWQKGTEQVEIGVGRPRRILLSVPVDDHPLQHEYVVRYLPPEWVTESPTAKGFRRVEIDLREVLGNTWSDLVSLHLLLRGAQGAGLTAAEHEGSSTFWLKNVAFAKRLPYPAKDNCGLQAELRALLNRPLLEIDGKPITLHPPVGQTSVLDRDGYWLEPLKVRLTAGLHNLKILPHSTFKVDLVEVANETSGKSAVNSLQSPKIDFKKINPTRYVVDVKDAKGPFTLVFSESFHEGWKGYIRKRLEVRGQMLEAPQTSNLKPQTFSEEPWSALWTAWKDRGNRTEIKDHFVVNGYANGWIVYPSAVDSQQSFEIVLEFKPQRLFEIGLIISMTTLFGCIGYLGYDFRKRRKGNGQS